MLVWWISAVHSQHGPGISCSLEAMKARKLRRRLDKMARDRGRLYTGREKLRGKRDEKSYSNYLTAALCPLKQLCSNRSHLELLSYSFTYNTCLHGNARSYAVHIFSSKLTSYVSPARKFFWPSCWTGTSLFRVSPKPDAWTVHGRVASRFAR